MLIEIKCVFIWRYISSVFFEVFIGVRRVQKCEYARVVSVYVLLCVSLKKIAIYQLLWIFCNLLSKEKENSFGQQLNIHLGV